MRSSRQQHAFLLALAALVLSPAQVLAIDFAGVDLRPYVLVQETCFYDGRQEPTIPLGWSKTDQSTFISQGGAVTASRARQEIFAPYEGGFLQGLASPSERASFASTVNAARLGVQATCSYFLECHDGGQTVVTWYGRNNARRNSFAIVDSLSPANANVANCPPEIDEFLTGLRQLLFDIQRHPNTELTFSGPSAVPR